MGTHMRACADRYSASYPHTVTLKMAGVAPCERPRTQDARQRAIAGALSASRLTWNREPSCFLQTRLCESAHFVMQREACGHADLFHERWNLIPSQ